jgi:hypothetical protein
MLSDPLTVGALGIAAVGLAFAVRQYRDARTQIERLVETSEGVDDARLRLDSVVDRLDTVAHALPTRALGAWPSYLDDLAKMIDRTETELTILCDYPAYGIISNPEGYRKYRRAIETRLVAGANVRAIFLDRKKRATINDEFFPHEQDWDEAYRKGVDAFMKRERDPNAAVLEPVTLSDLIEQLDACDDAMLQSLDSAALLGRNHRGVQVLLRRETSSLMPLYFWMRDGSEAVFAIALLAEGKHKEIAFVTSDPNLIAALKGTFDRYLGELDPDWDS